MRRRSPRASVSSAGSSTRPSRPRTRRKAWPPSSRSASRATRTADLQNHPIFKAVIASAAKQSTPAPARWTASPPARSDGPAERCRSKRSGPMTTAIDIVLPMFALMLCGYVAARGPRELAIVYAYFSGCLLVFAASMAVGRLAFRLTLREQAVMGFTATFSNTVLLGIPLIYAGFGQAGILPVTLITSFHSIILLTLATVIVELGAGSGRRFLRALPKTLLALLRNPLLIAIAAGFAARALGWRLPV